VGFCFLASLSSSTPESLGLKHLAIRPKKQQLIEDQRQKVAKENAKLMSGMTKVCEVFVAQSIWRTTNLLASVPLYFFCKDHE